MTATISNANSTNTLKRPARPGPAAPGKVNSVAVPRIAAQRIRAKAMDVVFTFEQRQGGIPALNLGEPGFPEYVRHPQPDTEVECRREEPQPAGDRSGEAGDTFNEIHAMSPTIEKSAAPDISVSCGTYASCTSVMTAFATCRRSAAGRS